MLWHKTQGAGGIGGGGISFVGSSVEYTNGGTSNITRSLTSLTGGLSSAPAAGDLVIVYFGVSTFGVDRDLEISGYTELVELYQSDTYAINLVVAYKFMGATPDTSFTLVGGTGGVGDGGATAAYVFRGVDQTTPLDVSRTTSQSSNSALVDPPAITPITAGAVIVAGGAAGHNDGDHPPFTSSDLTQFKSISSRTTKDAVIGVGYHDWTSGSFNPAQFSWSGFNSSQFSRAAVTMALRPESV